MFSNLYSVPPGSIKSILELRKHSGSGQLENQQVFLAEMLSGHVSIKLIAIVGLSVRKRGKWMETKVYRPALLPPNQSSKSSLGDG